MILVSCGCSRHVSHSSSSDNPSVESSIIPNPSVESSSDTPVPTVPPVSSSSENISTSEEQKSYTITWQNYDGSVLEIDYNVPYGTMPSYDYETPTKPDSDGNSYRFVGWSPTVVPVVENATYVAQFVAESSTTETFFVIWENYDNTELEFDENVPYGTMPEYNGPTPTRPDEGGHLLNQLHPTLSILRNIEIQQRQMLIPSLGKTMMALL